MSSRKGSSTKGAARELLLFGGVLVGVCLYLFREPLFSPLSLWAADNYPIVAFPLKNALPSSYLGRWNSIFLGRPWGAYGLLPSRALLLFLSPSFYHGFAYAFNVMLLGLAGYYLLAGLGLRAWARCLGALALAFSGHSFTLVSAGHLGKFEMLPMAVLSLALLDRAVSGRSPLHFATAGITLALGFEAQPDVMAVFMILAGIFGLFRFVTCWSKQKPWRYICRIASGVVLMAAFFGVVGNAGISSFFREKLEARLRQIEQTAGGGAEAKWEFATNWSLPPEELLGCVMPGFFGLQTGEPVSPYWGRMGRTMGWRKSKRGLMNLRQHTVYLGVLQLVFGAFAIAHAAARRRQWRPSPSSKGAASSAATDGAYVVPAVNDVSACNRKGPPRADVLFWAGVCLVGVLLALGRYFPLYRLFYMLPYASNMRAPVKFVHVVEVAVTVLFAYGLDLLFALNSDKMTRYRHESLAGPAKRARTHKPTSDHSRDRERRVCLVFGIACLGTGVILLLSLPVLRALLPGLQAYWCELGLGQYVGTIAGRMSGSVTHCGILLLLAAGFCFAAWWQVRERWVTAGLPLVVALVLVSDLVSVDSPYVRTRDFRPFLNNNALLDRLAAEPEPFRLDCPFPGPPFEQWNGMMFRAHLVDTLRRVSTTQLPVDYQAFFGALNSNPERLWQLSNCKFVLGPASALAGIVRHPAFESEMTFDMDSSGRIVERGDGGRFVLARYRAALPRALVYHAWESLAEDEVLARLAAPTWDPSRSVLVTDGDSDRRTESPPTVVESIAHRPQRVEVAVDLHDEGILLLNDKHGPGWEAYVDGKEQEILRCNFLMRGVRLPAGKHRVLFVYRPHLREFLVTVCALLALVVWGVARAYLVKREGAAPRGSGAGGLGPATDG